MCTIPTNTDSHDTLNLSDTIPKFRTVDIIVILCYSYFGRSYNEYVI
jgi:hypothetical protein